MIKIINADGTTGTVEIPEGAKLDTKSMGLLANDEVGAFKSKYLQQGKDSVAGDVQRLTEEKDTIANELASLKSSLSSKDKNNSAQAMQIEALQKSLDSLNQKFETKDKEAAQLKFASDVRNAAEGLGLIQSAFPILQAHVSEKAIDGGFMAADGSTIDLKGIVEEWGNSEIGKRLTLSAERGGGGTSPDTFSGGSYADYHKAGKQNEYIQKYGREKYVKEMTAYRRSQKGS